jgi:hypothetical protein
LDVSLVAIAPLTLLSAGMESNLELLGMEVRAMK